MKPHIIAAAAAGASIVLSGCAGVGHLFEPVAGGASVGEALLQHIEQCDRHYQGALGAGVTGAFEISCKAQPPVNLAGVKAE